MTRKLLVVFASGLVLSIVLLSMAWVVGGHDLMTRIEKDGGYSLSFDDDDDTSHGAKTTRTLAFDASKPLEVAAPVRLHFTRGETAGMTVSGPKQLVDSVRWEGGRLSLGTTPLFVHHTLDVEIRGPRMPSLVYKGAGDIELENLDQPALALEMAGAGNVEANGRVDSLTIHAKGAGNIDMEKLLAHDATITSAGVGNIDVSATGKVDATLSGAGNISLHRKPAELTSRVNGIGSIGEDY